jgi:hypothetical protein
LRTEDADGRQITLTHSIRQLWEVAKPADNFVRVNEPGNFSFPTVRCYHDRDRILHFGLRCRFLVTDAACHCQPSFVLLQPETDDADWVAILQESGRARPFRVSGFTIGGPTARAFRQSAVKHDHTLYA